MPASQTTTIIIAASIGSGIVVFFIVGICVWSRLYSRKHQKQQQAHDEGQQARGEQEATNERVGPNAQELMIDHYTQQEQWRQKLVDQEKLLVEAKLDEAYKHGIETQSSDPNIVADQIFAASNMEFIEKKRAEGGEAELDLQLLASAPENDELYPDDSYSNAGLVLERAQFRDKRLAQVWNSKQLELRELYENQTRLMEIEEERHQLIRRRSVLESAASREGSPMAAAAASSGPISPTARSNTPGSKRSKRNEIEAIPLKNLTPISATGTRSQDSPRYFVGAPALTIPPISPLRPGRHGSPILASLQESSHDPRDTILSSISKLEFPGDSEPTGPEYSTNFADYETTITQDPWRSEAARNYAAQRLPPTNTQSTVQGDVVAQLMQEDRQRQFMERARNVSEQAESSQRQAEMEKWDETDNGKNKLQ